MTSSKPGAEHPEARMPETGTPETGMDQPQAPVDDAAPAAEPDGRVVELEAETARLKDQLFRALADQENMRKRTEREREDTAKYAVSKFAKDLLSAADNLRRAIESVPADNQDGPLRTLLAGVAATEKELLGALERNGVKRHDPIDQTFDHNYHQAIFETENTGKPAGTIVQVLQPGYTLNGRLLREAMVAVAKGDGGPKAPEPMRVDTTA